MTNVENAVPRPFLIDFGKLVEMKAEKKVKQEARLLEMQSREDLPEWFAESFEKDLNDLLKLQRRI